MSQMSLFVCCGISSNWISIMPIVRCLHNLQFPHCLLSLCLSTHEQSGPTLRQPDTRPESLKHQLSLNYSFCQWASPGPLCSLISELMGHCLCWPEVKERNAKPLVHQEEMKTCFSLVTWLAGKIDGQKTACRGRKWACRCMYACECVLWSKEVSICHVLCFPQVWFAWPVILSCVHLSNTKALPPCRSACFPH